MANTNLSNFKMDHLSIADAEVVHQLNTYRNWGDVDLLMDPFPKTKDEDLPPINAKGTRSLFNNVHAIYYADGFRMRNNMPLLDGPDIREKMREYGDCSIKKLIELSKNNKMGRAIYNYSDFMYCKNLGRVSNNYMITLRRFSTPCGDSINYINPDDNDEINTQNGLQGHAPDVGRLVTWLGTPGNDMSSILKYSYKMPFKEETAEIQEKDGAGGSDRGILGTLMNASSPKYREMQIAGMGGDQASQYVGKLFGGSKLGTNFFQGNNAGSPYTSAEWRSHRDKNKVYGPIDVIKKTTIRGEEGLEFTHSFTLTFDYELRSYDGINTKSAFLDLLGNILTVTYNTGTFWGGGYRMTAGMPQSNVYANLPIFKNAQEGNIKNFGDLVDSSLKSVQDVWKTISNGEGLEGAIKTIGSAMFSSFLGTALNQLGRPTKIAYNSLLQPAPTGLWHVTIGNPRHPILSMGNLILENTEIEHYGPLGLDDFPTGLRVTCTLKHGKPRDTSMIEAMYTMGNSRVYIPVGEQVMEMYEKSTPYKKAKQKNNATKGNANVPTDTSSVDYASMDMTKEQVLNLYFGTSDKSIIVPSAQEQAFGSQMLKENSVAVSDTIP